MRLYLLTRCSFRPTDHGVEEGERGEEDEDGEINGLMELTFRKEQSE